MPISTPTSSGWDSSWQAAVTALIAKANALPDTITVDATVPTSLAVSSDPVSSYALAVDAEVFNYASGDLSVFGGDSIADIPGLSTTLTSPGTSAKWDVSAFLDVAAFADNTRYVLSVKCYVDGSEITGEMLVRLPVTGERETFGFQWQITGLSAGSHTVKLRVTPVDQGGTDGPGEHYIGGGSNWKIERKR